MSKTRSSLPLAVELLGTHLFSLEEALVLWSKREISSEFTKVVFGVASLSLEAVVLDWSVDEVLGGWLLPGGVWAWSSWSLLGMKM